MDIRILIDYNFFGWVVRGAVYAMGQKNCQQRNQADTSDKHGKTKDIFRCGAHSGVIPNDEPVVKTAETDSKITSVGLLAGSSAIKVQLIIMVNSIERVITAFARRTECMAMLRLKAFTPFRPVTIDLRFNKRTPKVLTFIPPAIDCEAPPIHI